MRHLLIGFLLYRRSGVKAGLGPGSEVIIKKPKARGAGKTPYSDDTIHPNTFLFLKDLKQNNDRQWLKSMIHHSPFLLTVESTDASLTVHSMVKARASVCAGRDSMQAATVRGLLLVPSLYPQDAHYHMRWSCTHLQADPTVNLSHFAPCSSMTSSLRVRYADERGSE